MSAKNLCNTHYLQLIPRVRGKRFSRNNIVQELNRTLGIPTRTGKKIVRAVFSTIIAGLKRGEQVKIPGFGIFDTHSLHYNPWGLSPYFRPSKELKYMIRYEEYKP